MLVHCERNYLSKFEIWFELCFIDFFSDLFNLILFQRLHLGIYFNNPNKISVKDCASDQFFSLFKKVSKQNSKIYEDLFKCLPSNEAKTFESMTEFVNQPKLAKTDPNKARQLLENHVSGFIVDFPLEFLQDESRFFPSMNTKEGLVPVIVWT